MSLTVKKSLIVVGDISFGFGSAEQERDGDRFNASHLPYTLTESVFDAISDRYTKTEANGTFAARSGNVLQVFNVATPVLDTEATPKAYVDTGLSSKVDTSSVLTLTNEVEYTPLYNFNPATKLYVDSTLSVTMENYIAKNNVLAFSPTGQYNPATKKYTDDLIANNVTAVGALKIRPASSIDPSTTGQLVFELTDDSTLTVKVMGYDSVIRTAVITLT